MRLLTRLFKRYILREISAGDAYAMKDVQLSNASLSDIKRGIRKIYTEVNPQDTSYYKRKEDD